MWCGTFLLLRSFQIVSVQHAVKSRFESLLPHFLLHFLLVVSCLVKCQCWLSYHFHHFHHCRHNCSDRSYLGCPGCPGCPSCRWNVAQCHFHVFVIVVNVVAGEREGRCIDDLCKFGFFLLEWLLDRIAVLFHLDVCLVLRLRVLECMFKVNLAKLRVSLKHGSPGKYFSGKKEFYPPITGSSVCFGKFEKEKTRRQTPTTKRIERPVHLFVHSVFIMCFVATAHVSVQQPSKIVHSETELAKLFEDYRVVVNSSHSHTGTTRSRVLE